MMANISLQTQQNTNLQSIMQVSNASGNPSSAATNKVLIGGHTHTFSSHSSHIHRHHTLTFPNLGTLFASSSPSSPSSSLSVSSSHSIIAPSTTTNMTTLINGNKIIVRPINYIQKNNTMMTNAKCSNQLIIDNNNSTITAGNGNLLLFASNICHSTRTLIQKNNFVNGSLLKTKSEIADIVKCSSNIDMTSSTISWKLAKSNNGQQQSNQQQSFSLKCPSRQEQDSHKAIKVAVNPKSINFNHQNLQNSTNNCRQSIETLNHSANNQKSTTIRFVNRLNSYHNEKLPENIFDTDDEEDDDELDTYFNPFNHHHELTSIDNLVIDQQPIDQQPSLSMDESSDNKMISTTNSKLTPTLINQCLPVSDHMMIHNGNYPNVESINSINENDSNSLNTNGSLPVAVASTIQSMMSTISDDKLNKISMINNDIVVAAAAVQSSTCKLDPSCSSDLPIRIDFKKPSNAMKRPNVQNGNVDLPKRKGRKKKNKTMDDQQQQQQQQRLMLLQEKRKQVWLQLLPQIVRKKDKTTAQRIERQQRLQCIARECSREFLKKDIKTEKY